MAKHKGDKPKLVNCTPGDVWGALRKIGGFVDKDGSKHSKVEHSATKHCSTIPRGNPINKHLLKDFIEDYLVEKVERPS